MKNSLNDGFYLVKNGYHYKALQTTENWNKCALCAFQYHNECNTTQEIKRVCDALKDYYWISIIDIQSINNYLWQQTDYNRINLTINNNLY